MTQSCQLFYHKNMTNPKFATVILHKAVIQEALDSKALVPEAVLAECMSVMRRKVETFLEGVGHSLPVEKP